MTEGAADREPDRNELGPHEFIDPELKLVWSVLNRNSQLPAFEELYRGLEANGRPALDTGVKIAFGFDTNALYRLGLNGTSGDNAIDYLRQQHDGPVIIPGQAVQEIWNNILAGLEPQAKKILRAFDQLESDLKAIDQTLDAAGDEARQAIDALSRTHTDWLDPASFDVFKRTVEALLTVSKVSYVPRLEFSELARVRHETKTPPGFRDDSNNHGDFFVWADFLYGLASLPPDDFEACVFVTDEKKIDWRRNAIEHPILVAEAIAIAGVPFRLWTVGDFQRHVNTLVA